MSKFYEKLIELNIPIIIVSGGIKEIIIEFMQLLNIKGLNEYIKTEGNNIKDNKTDEQSEINEIITKPNINEDSNFINQENEINEKMDEESVVIYQRLLQPNLKSQKRKQMKKMNLTNQKKI